MPDWDSTERRDSDEDAAWRDLVARFDAPEAADQPSPWPELENTAAANAADADIADSPPASPVRTGTSTTSEGAAASAGTWRVAPTPPADPDDEHFVPPPPPPLPKLEPLTKAAWLGLFGGPAYLLVATAAGWSIPGIAVFCAIAAFVGGVALLVIRLNDSDPRSPGGDDDGAVV
ncbi:MAG: hypothetical protein JO345_22745 [Streptosporangiaceae bacterium]|nr:hypothetical protein [Streptosporangiaceae bacterium]